MTNHHKYMHRCIEIARLAAGSVAPNPMVGCVIVCNGKIIGEGYHVEFGGPHAEVNAIHSVRFPELLMKSTLYVSLEPCSHYGKTPPCSDLIIKSGIPHVVIGTIDPYSEVAGKGIEKLTHGGVMVESGILEEECRWLNRRFFTFHEKKRPYVILKWAQSSDGFIARELTENGKTGPLWISNALSRRLVHKCRAEEASILIGTETALHDNPSLTVRDWSGKSPLRLVIDRNGRLQSELRIFDKEVKTIIFTAEHALAENNPEYVPIDFNQDVIPQILMELYNRDVQSLYVEGGAITLQRFIDAGQWDEAHIFRGDVMLFKGKKAPLLSGRTIAQESLDDNLLTVVVNA
jgi:diaminohydroxyphosphoribosylaminopyrimidine deaminase / 5-amino-6-(5-phosphoribosylamino)uracil reductase